MGDPGFPACAPVTNLARPACSDESISVIDQEMRALQNTQVMRGTILE